MNKLIEIELFRYRNILFGSVINMDESLRGKEVIGEDGSYKIRSGQVPEMSEYSIWLLGKTKEKDRQAFSYVYNTEEKAKYAGSKFNELIRKINNEENKNDKDIIRII